MAAGTVTIAERDLARQIRSGFALVTTADFTALNTSRKDASADVYEFLLEGNFVEREEKVKGLRALLFQVEERDMGVRRQIRSPRDVRCI